MHGKTKRKYSPKKRRSSSYYLRIIALSTIAGVAFFLIGNFLIPQQLPCANSKSCQTDRSVQIDNAATGTFQGHRVVPPKIDLAHDDLTRSVLGENVSGEKHIYVDLATQKLYAFQGGTQIMETFISSGKWNPTVVGNFHIWEKLRATRMAGGEGADAYDLPNVPYVMYFYQDYGLHGAYWHNNFGHMMSHGCVNMRIVDARSLYEWADGPTADHPGTAVSVCNSFTKPNACVQDKPINQ